MKNKATKTAVRLSALALGVALLLGAAALAAQTGDVDPLVTLAYLNGAFADTMTENMHTIADAAAAQSQTAYQTQAAAMEQALDDRYAQSQPLASAYQTITLSAGQTWSVEAGTELLFLAGAANATTALSDVTQGALLAAGTALQECHLYIGIAGGEITAARDSTLLVK